VRKEQQEPDQAASSRGEGAKEEQKELQRALQ
jgi:hypothetical protein